eukprot:972212-Pyramimonas_sp.AAC.1
MHGPRIELVDARQPNVDRQPPGRGRILDVSDQYKSATRFNTKMKRQTVAGIARLRRHCRLPRT